MSAGYRRRAGASVGSIFGPPMTSGRWFLPWDTNGLTTGTIGANGSMVLIPIQFGKPCVINGMAVNVTTQGEAGSLIRLGLYNDADGIPASLAADFGTTAGDVLGVRSLTPSFAVKAGWYWQAIVAQSAPTTRPVVSLPQNTIGARVGVATPGTAAASTYFQVGVSGALPDPCVIGGQSSSVTAAAAWMKAA